MANDAAEPSKREFQRVVTDEQLGIPLEEIGFFVVIPLAAILWAGGISFAGVMAFIFADLIVLPIVVAYRKYYGTAFALRITALMFVTMVLAALAIDLVFSGLGLIPDARPTTEDVFGSIEVNYKLVLNVVATRLSPVDALVNDRTDDADGRERRTRVDLARQQRMFR